MDLERIKQNLRLRSGRSKKTRYSKAPAQAPPQNKPVPPPAIAKVDQQPVSERTLEQEKENLRKPVGVDQTKRQEPEYSFSDSVKHRPNLPHAATNMNGAVIAPGRRQQDSTSYGRSGMDKPRRKPPPAIVERAMSEPKMSSEESDVRDYNLRPPPRKQKPLSLEGLSELLFSEGHLNTILHDAQLLLRLITFLTRYKPDMSPLLIRYLETQKAVKAVEYANAVAASVTPMPSNDAGQQDTAPEMAAQLDAAFAEASSAVFSSLMTSALPAYVTYSLVKVVTECLTNEITGRSTPIMRDLVGGLSEVFCLTDPTQEDNPIIYASEEFYRLTGYDTDDVIGCNCRFLQGPKTKRDAPQRLRDGQDKGEQVCETLLNYRRDGRAFVNLLLIAPLYDDKEKLKYYIGAQVDVSRLVEGGKGLDGFEKFLANREKRQRGRPRRGETDLDLKKQNALDKLRELSEMFDLEESAVVQSHSRASSMSRDDDSIASKDRPKTARRVLADSSKSDDEDEGDSTDETEKAEWSLARSGPSGKLPGVYERYMLIRPAPSSRIIFVSPALRNIGDIAQSPFMSHVLAPANTLAGLKESFRSGTPVTAKIGFMTEAGKLRDGTRSDQRNGDSKVVDDAARGAKTCWISATPMLDGDDRIGVWMIVMVLKGKGSAKALDQKLMSKSKPNFKANQSPRSTEPSRRELQMNDTYTTPTRPSRQKLQEEGHPIKPRRLDSTNEVSSKSPAEGREHDGFEDVPKAENYRDGQVMGRSNGDDANDEDVFTRRHVSRSPQQSDRVIIRPDSDDEDDGGAKHASDPDNANHKPEGEHEAKSRPESPDADDGGVKHDSGPNNANHTPEGEYQATSRPESPDADTVRSPSPPLEMTDQSPELDEMTPTRWKETYNSRQEQKDNRTPSPSRPSTPGGPESKSARPSGMLYMDYLRHPGSGSAMPREGEGEGEDPDCASPYSVD